MNLVPWVWRAGSAFDDPSTPGVNEADIIRAVARRARWVLLARAPQFTPAEIDAMIADVEPEGVATVISYDARCGYGNPPPGFEVVFEGHGGYSDIEERYLPSGCRSPP